MRGRYPRSRVFYLSALDLLGDKLEIAVQNAHDFVIFFLRLGEEGIGHGDVSARGEFGEVDIFFPPFFGNKIFMPARHAYDEVRLFEAFGETAPKGGGVLVQRLRGKAFGKQRGARFGVKLFALMKDRAALYPLYVQGKFAVFFAHTLEYEFAIRAAADVGRTHK